MTNTRYERQCPLWHTCELLWPFPIIPLTAKWFEVNIGCLLFFQKVGFQTSIDNTWNTCVWWRRRHMRDVTSATVWWLIPTKYTICRLHGVIDVISFWYRRTMTLHCIVTSMTRQLDDSFSRIALHLCCHRDSCRVVLMLTLEMWRDPSVSCVVVSYGWHTLRHLL